MVEAVGSPAASNVRVEMVEGDLEEIGDGGGADLSGTREAPGVDAGSVLKRRPTQLIHEGLALARVEPAIGAIGMSSQDGSDPGEPGGNLG